MAAAAPPRPSPLNGPHRRAQLSRRMSLVQKMFGASGRANFLFAAVGASTQILKSTSVVPPREKKSVGASLVPKYQHFLKDIKVRFLTLSTFLTDFDLRYSAAARAARPRMSRLLLTCLSHILLRAAPAFAFAGASPPVLHLGAPPCGRSARACALNPKPRGPSSATARLATTLNRGARHPGRFVAAARARRGKLARRLHVIKSGPN
jgi:hypothetical protein